jgi:hypothetical protein
MFTTLTIIAAWFSFGYCVTDIVITNRKNAAQLKATLEESKYYN